MFIVYVNFKPIKNLDFFLMYCIIIPPLPEGGGGYTVLPLSVQDIFRCIFLSNCWWQESDIWSQASYRYAILWEAFLDPSDSYFLFADFVDFYTHWTYMLIFRRIFLSNFTIDGRNLIFGHKLHIGTPYRGKRFLTRQIPTSCCRRAGYHTWALAHSSSCSILFLNFISDNIEQ